MLTSLNLKLAMTLLTIVLIAFLAVHCSDNPATPPEGTLAKLTCIECHTDDVKLMELATVEPPPSGEAGEG